MKPEISYYGQTSTPQTNARREDYDNITLWYSYNTVVAFRYKGVKVVSENCWRTTTGKHLNWIDGGDHKNRKPRAEFEALLKTTEREAGI